MAGRPNTERSITDVVNALVEAVNDHDLTRIVDCFADEYVNETPTHPERGFRGKEQVRNNWSTILTTVPDIEVRVLSMAVSGNSVWTEWEHRGTRADGSRLLLAGVIIFTVVAGAVTRVRFYLEPVDSAGDGITDAIRTTFGAPSDAPRKDRS